MVVSPNAEEELTHECIAPRARIAQVAEHIDGAAAAAVLAGADVGLAACLQKVVFVHVVRVYMSVVSHLYYRLTPSKRM